MPSSLRGLTYRRPRWSRPRWSRPRWSRSRPFSSRLVNNRVYQTPIFMPRLGSAVSRPCPAPAPPSPVPARAPAPAPAPGSALDRSPAGRAVGRARRNGGTALMADGSLRSRSLKCPRLHRCRHRPHASEACSWCTRDDDLRLVTPQNRPCDSDDCRDEPYVRPVRPAHARTSGACRGLDEEREDREKELQADHDRENLPMRKR